MSGQRYTPEFKDEAVKLITERGYSVSDVAERLGVSQHSIYKWLKAEQLDKIKTVILAALVSKAVTNQQEKLSN
ncbi:transposase [Acinetobacter radioresistens]|nr:transposase [Acinetobacter radioresistens]